MGYRKPPFPDHFEQEKKYQHQHQDAGHRSDQSAEPVATRK
jgi:hypothetical protein